MERCAPSLHSCLRMMIRADPVDAGPRREGARGARERDNPIQEHQAHAPAEERRGARPPAPPLALRARGRRALTRSR